MGKPFGAVITYCPQCNKPIGEEHPYSWCAECGEHLPEEVQALLPLVATQKAYQRSIEVRAAPADQLARGENGFFSFRGRIGRKTFWLTLLTVFGINILIRLLSVIGRDNGTIVVLWLPFAVWLGIATQVKRWHDRDKSGWMVLINLIPIVGLVWALIELGFLPGTPGPNRFDAPTRLDEPSS